METDVCRFIVMLAAIFEWALFGYSIKAKYTLTAISTFCFGLLFSFSSTFC